jgi:hypothetical protein
METKKEKIYKKFQTIFRKNPMLVVGTGVSVAVHEKLGMNVNTSARHCGLFTVLHGVLIMKSIIATAHDIRYRINL